jgi:hypothetical protein
MANNFHRNINGSALVQILVGLVVGCAVILGAEKAYDIVNREYIEQVAHMSSASEEQYASAIFTTILDQAGYAGCGVDRSWQDNVYIGFGGSIFNEPVIYGIDDSDTEAIKKLNIDKDGSGKYAPRSDVLIVKSSGLSGQEALYKQLDSGQQQLDLITNLSIKEDDILLFHDCIQFNAFQVKEANSEQDEQKILLYGEVPRNIPVGSILSIYQKSILYVGEAPRKINGKQVYSLYEKNEYGVRNELIQNITSLKIEYLAENGEFVSANKITNWLLVKEIKIKLTTYQDDHVEEAHIAIKRNIP